MAPSKNIFCPPLSAIKDDFLHSKIVTMVIFFPFKALWVDLEDVIVYVEITLYMSCNIGLTQCSIIALRVTKYLEGISSYHDGHLSYLTSLLVNQM